MKHNSLRNQIGKLKSLEMTDPVDVPEPQPLQAEEVDVPDADRKVEPPIESRSKGSSSSVHDDDSTKTLKDHWVRRR
jgi:hypothetical protein